MSAAINNNDSPVSFSEADISQWQQELHTLRERLRQGRFSQKNRFAYLQHLRQVLPYINIHELPEASFTCLSEVLSWLCDWWLLVELKQQRLSGKAIDARDRFSLAEYYMQVGDYFSARGIVEKQMLTEPRNQQFYNYWKFLNDHCHEANRLSLIQSDTEVLLTPLREHHLHDFSWQFSPSIKELCNLQDFAHNQEWLDWLNFMTSDSNRVIFAVVHRSWGFIGCVSLQVYEGIGFFYYWIGEDFQGYGFGPKAVDMLLKFGEQRMGMQECYAKIYQRNTNSHKAIKKLGFNPLNIYALPPDEDEVFYHLGSELSPHQQFLNLQYLLGRMDSFLQIVPGNISTLPQSAG